MNSPANPVSKPPRRGGSGLVLKNISSNWVSLLANVLITLFMAPFIVGKLGDTYYGIWTLLMQFTAYLWLFDFGIRESVVKYVAQHHAADEHDQLKATVNAAVFVYTAVGIVTLLGAVAMAIALPAIFNIPGDAVTTARLTLLLTGATVAQAFVFNVYVGMLMGLQKFYLVARLGVFITVIRAALIFVLLSAGYGIVAMGVVHFGLSLLTSVIVYGYCRRELPDASAAFARPQRADIARVVSYGKYVLLTNLGEKLVYATDSLVIGMFMPVASVAYYAVAGSLVAYLRSFITAMSVVINPMTSSLSATNETARLRLVVQTSAKAAVIAGLPVCIGFIMLGGLFIGLWMGPAFGELSGPVLTILGMSYLLALPQHTVTATLLGLGRHRITAVARGFEAVANLTLSIVLVQRYGLVGVALGTLIPNVILALVALPIALTRVVGLDLKQYYVEVYGRTLLASLPFWAACWFIANVVVPRTMLAFVAFGAAAVVFYAVPAWLIALSAEDRRMIRQRTRFGKRTHAPVAAEPQRTT